MRIVVKAHDMSSSKGSIMAARMLTQWLKIIEQSAPHDPNQEGLEIIITDAGRKDQFSPKGEEKHILVLLEGAEIHPVHLLALSGNLCTFGQQEAKPFFPKHLLEMVMASSVAMSILSLVYTWKAHDHHDYDRPQIVRLSCLECLKYFGAFNVSAVHNGLVNEDKLRGKNVLDGGAPFYQIFRCADNTHLCLGNLEPKFFEEMIGELEISASEKEFCLENQMNMEAWGQMRDILTTKFQQKRADEWEKIMQKRDTCIVAMRPIGKQDQHYLHPRILRPKL